MPHEFKTRDISGQFILLGTGTSVGVPVIGCACQVCRSDNPRNKRTRSSAIVGLPEGNLLIDTSPELRIQLLREEIGIVHSVAYTHEHADHIFGLDDLRLFPFQLHAPVPLFCEPNVESRIRQSFDYAFKTGPQTHPGAIPALEPRTISTAPFDALGATIRPLRLQHGPNYRVLGFRIGNIAYCTDTSCIPEESFETLAGCEVLIVDALRLEPHPTHFNVEQALAAIERIQPQKAYLTHVSHELEYVATNAILPGGVELAYDGLSLDLKLG
ncbi:MBL fold metallo-hydrolase [Aureliella helgolandensis]|uniref:Phosphoribosyl 1,2-cyclic phosphodiesterase n=1 Tax=Aureliella helgolandensis TaxID=2527968 RepID=A0A518G579_9BACT|nr:MBL fold metallo-hydrolase [Aureliella helgolandensis]QDV23751.1 Phosphoribosyl 1,2-cyclic phosphodiesterase [Aureliella helgolandensis]